MVIVVFFFFFQAEDGIRDLVRSRGLGDVYKRQVDTCAAALGYGLQLYFDFSGYADMAIGLGMMFGTVSYTHLTLPTSDLV